MVLIFFDDELENTDPNIAVIVKKNQQKLVFTRAVVCSAENHRAFLWPGQ